MYGTCTFKEILNLQAVTFLVFFASYFTFWIPSSRVADPDPYVSDPDPLVKAEARIRILYHQAKTERETLFLLFCEFYMNLSLKNNVNVPSKSNKKKNFNFCCLHEGH